MFFSVISLVRPLMSRFFSIKSFCSELTEFYYNWALTRKTLRYELDDTLIKAYKISQSRRSELLWSKEGIDCN